MPWYVYLALKQLFPAGKILHFFTVMSICGVMLGVMILVIVQTVMNGFGEELRSKIVDTGGHVRVESGGTLRDYEQLLADLRDRPEVREASPYAHGVLMIQHDNRPGFPMSRSIEYDGDVVPIEDYLLHGELDDLDDDSVFLSSGLAMQIGARMGSVIEVYSPMMLEHLREDAVLLPREVEVAGIFEVGWHQVDSNTMVTSRRLMQDLYGLNGGVHGISLRLNPGYDSTSVARQLTERLESPKIAFSWMEANRDFLFILRLEKNVMFFLLLFIVLVAAFSISSSLLMTVVRKTREIGLLGALGGRPKEIAACFCFQGLVLGTAGTILGVTLGVLALQFRNQIIHGFARITQSEDALREFYQFTEIPVHYATGDFIVIVTAAIVISTLAGLLPAWRAARLKPTEAFHNE